MNKQTVRDDELEIGLANIMIDICVECPSHVSRLEGDCRDCYIFHETKEKFDTLYREHYKKKIVEALKDKKTGVTSNLQREQFFAYRSDDVDKALNACEEG